jgi:hypothetical protein
VLTSVFDRFVSNQQSEKIWVCPRCNTDNRLRETRFEQTILSQPYYLGVVSKPPNRDDDLGSHVGYDKLLERWCWTMLDELEEKMAQFRDDNWERGEEDPTWRFDIDTGLEDSET